MTKNEIKTAHDSDLIMDYISTYSRAMLNENCGLPTKALDKHLKDLDCEMLKRGLLTQDQIDCLNK